MTYCHWVLMCNDRVESWRWLYVTQIKILMLLHLLVSIVLFGNSSKDFYKQTCLEKATAVHKASLYITDKLFQNIKPTNFYQIIVKSLNVSLIIIFIFLRSQPKKNVSKFFLEYY